MAELALQERLPVIDYGRHPAYAVDPDPELGRQALEALAPLVEEMRAREQFRARHFAYQYRYDSELGERLAREGSIQLQAPESATRALLAETAPILAAVEARIDEIRSAGRIARFTDRMQPFDGQSQPAAAQALHRCLKATGVYQLARTYLGAPGLSVKQAVAMISRPQDHKAAQSWGAQDRLPTEGMHVDSAGRCMLKVVLYLSEVGPGDGPFRIVNTSHRWSPDSLDRIYRRAFDKSPLVGRSTQMRRMFVSLPRELQVKAEFGGDLPPESADARRLLSDEAVSLGPPGLLTLFDPEAVHRGGLPANGERRALLVTLFGQYSEVFQSSLKD